MPIRFFMYPVRVPPHMRSQIAKESQRVGIQIDRSAVADDPRPSIAAAIQKRNKNPGTPANQELARVRCQA
jgi:hypothetical protein